MCVGNLDTKSLRLVKTSTLKKKKKNPMCLCGHILGIYIIGTSKNDSQTDGQLLLIALSFCEDISILYWNDASTIRLNILARRLHEPCRVGFLC